MTHATVAAWSRHGCRCPTCHDFMRGYWRSKQRRRGRPAIRRGFTDASVSRGLVLRLARDYTPHVLAEHFAARFGGTGYAAEKRLGRLLLGVRWGVCHVPGPAPQLIIREETEDQLWVLRATL